MSQTAQFNYTLSKEFIEFQQKLSQSLTDKIKDNWYYKEGDVYVPAHVHKIVSIDKTNMVTISIRPDGTTGYSKSCVIPSANPYTIEEYHSKFCSKMNNKWTYTSTEQCPSYSHNCSNCSN